MTPNEPYVRFTIGNMFAAQSDVLYVESLDGQVDELSVWNVVRTQEEIRDNMHRNLAGDESGLVAYYRFDEDSGTILPDESGNGHNGTLVNMTDDDWVTSYAVIGDETGQNQNDVRGYWNASTDSSWNNSSGLWMSGASFSSESDFTVFGHDGNTGTTSSDLPVGVKNRLDRVWYLDVNGSVAPDLGFNLEWSAGTGLGQLNPALYVLLNRPGAAGTFTEQTVAASRTGGS